MLLLWIFAQSFQRFDVDSLCFLLFERKKRGIAKN